MSSASNSSQRFEEAHFTFALTPQQVQQILTSRYVSRPSVCLIAGAYPWPLPALLPVRHPALPCLFAVLRTCNFSVSVCSARPSEGHILTPLPPCDREVLPGAKCDYTIQVQLR